MNQNSRIHPLDKLIYDDSLFFLEAMVPFVEYPYKKPLVLFIKYRELMSIMKSLDNKNYISSCGFDRHPTTTEEMLADMCSFLPGNISSSMQQMKQMMSMMEMMNMTQDNSHNSPDFSSIASMFSANSKQDTTKPDHSYSTREGLFESVLSILDNEKKE